MRFCDTTDLYIQWNTGLGNKIGSPCYFGWSFSNMISHTVIAATFMDLELDWAGIMFEKHRKVVPVSPFLNIFFFVYLVAFRNYLRTEK